MIPLLDSILERKYSFSLDKDSMVGCKTLSNYYSQCVSVVYEQVEDKSKAGTVIRQDPPGGTPAAEGTRVTLVVGKKGGN
jgi:hypothetical protein